MAAFYVWHPSIHPESPRKINFVITNGDVDGGIFQCREFIKSVLADAGIPGGVSECSVEPYRSKYFSDYADEEDWRDAWQLIWRVEVTKTADVGRLPKPKGPWVGTNATGKKLTPPPKESAAVGCLVVADFKTVKDLKKAQAAVGGEELSALREKYDADEPKFTHVKVSRNQQQLQIDLGQFPGKFFSKGAEYAERVAEICQAGGGRVNHQASL